MVARVISGNGSGWVAQLVRACGSYPQCRQFESAPSHKPKLAHGLWPASNLIMHYLYILRSEKDGNYYIGTSSDPERRLKEHNKGLSRATKYRKPFKLVHIEKFDTISEAYLREKWLKGLKSAKIIDKIVNGAVPT